MMALVSLSLGGTYPFPRTWRGTIIIPPNKMPVSLRNFLRLEEPGLLFIDQKFGNAGLYKGAINYVIFSYITL
jgi:hypothetical protein